MKTTAAALLVVLGIWALAGCDSPFTPKRGYAEKLIVYSVLSNRTDTQYVRLYATYDPTGFDPLVHSADNPITGATVTFETGGTSYPLRDTVVIRADKSRYGTDISEYVAYPFPSQRGVGYVLNVQTQDGREASARAVIPSYRYMAPWNKSVFVQPDLYDDRAMFGVQMVLDSATLGYLARCYIEFETTIGGITTTMRVEVPAYLKSVKDSLPQKVYPGLVRRETDPNSFSQAMEMATFSKVAYVSTISELYNKYGSQNLVLKRAVFVISQVESNLYRYYNIVNGFNDPNSIRLDQPFYNNIDGGYGLFGAYANDTLFVSY